MFDTGNSKRISGRLLFVICAIIGAVVFTGIYGTAILDFTNTGWLFNNDHDLRQHYVGWCAFRRDPWHFPIGLIDSLSYPNSMSVIYTDSIPIFAVAFKLISGYLPVTFQYFGLFGILSFMLMGGFSSLLLRRFISKDILCMIGSVFYVISAPVIQRMYFHTALAAQWLIIAALVLWVYDDVIKKKSTKMICWALLGFISVGIHTYFVPMLGMILAALMITQIVVKKGVMLPVMEFVAFCATGLLNLYILGAFYGVSSASGFGLGTFVSNLNTFINPLDIGRVLPELPLQNYFQYEGMAYLGAGILLLYVIVAAGLVFRMVRKVPEEAFHTKKVYGRVAAGLVIVSFVAAVFPVISFNDVLIGYIPCPQSLADILSIFRSNGRFIWPAMYVLITAAISFTAYTFRHEKAGVIVIAATLILQFYDMKDAFSQRYELYTSDYPLITVWDEEDLSGFMKGQKEFIFLYTENDITLPTGYYAYVHNMRQNNFYFARDIEMKVWENIDQYMAELEKGMIREGAVYVLRTEDYERNREIFDALDAWKIERPGHLLFRAK